MCFFELKENSNLRSSTGHRDTRIWSRKQENFGSGGPQQAKTQDHQMSGGEWVKITQLLSLSNEYLLSLLMEERILPALPAT